MRTIRAAVLLVAGIAFCQIIAAQDGHAPSIRVAFNIHAQMLTDALTDLSAQARVQVLRRDSSSDEEPTTRSVSGTLSVAEALELLLAGTGFTYEFVNERTVRISKEESETTSMSNDGMKLLRLAQTAVSVTSHEQDRDRFRVARESVAQARGQTQARNPQLEQIVVTGSRIRGTTPASPLVQIDRVLIESTGYTTTAQLLSSVPQNFSGSLTPNNLGASGSNILSNQAYAAGVDLRGLGDATLILVDGHRLANTSVNATADISAIPLGMVDRVDIVSDGTSAIYGSDAIGGAVNFILKRRFEGVRTTVSLGAGSEGGAEQQRYEMMAGAPWSSGSALFSYSFSRQNALAAADRSFSLAASPSELLPRIKSHNAAGFFTQSVGDSTEAYLQVLYNKRDANRDIGFFGSRLHDNSETSLFSAASGLNFDLPRRWSASFEAMAGRERMDQSQTTAFPVTATPLLSHAVREDNRSQSLELHLDGPLTRLGPNDIRVAIGAGYLRQKFTYDFPIGFPVSLNGGGTRDDTFAFAETVLPFVTGAQGRLGLRRLELSVAGRYDRYSDVGSSFNPKFGVVYEPARQLTLRGTWGSAFRAPAQFNEHAPIANFLRNRVDPTSPTGRSIVLEHGGGGRNLSPEEAAIWTAAIDVLPIPTSTLKVTATYFDYRFRDKVGIPISNPAAELVNPLFASFILRNPTPGQIQSVLDEGAFFINTAGAGTTAASAVAIADLRRANIASWTSKGVDLGVSWPMTLSTGRLTLRSDATWLRQEQQALRGGGTDVVTGETFGPPRFKARAGGYWTRGRWGAAVFANYIGSEVDIAQSPGARVASFTTADLQVSFIADTPLSGLRVALSALNMFDKDPPELAASSTPFPTGIGYDPTNASPLGRVLNLSTTLDW